MSGNTPRIDALDKVTINNTLDANIELGTTSDRVQILTPTAARTVKLNSTFLAGDRVEIINKSTTAANTLSITANDDVEKYSLNTGRIVLVANQDTPTGIAHWDRIYLEDNLTISLTGVGSGFTAGSLNINRRNDTVTISGVGTLTFSGTSVTSAAGAVPVKYQPTTNRTNTYLNSSSVIAYTTVRNDGVFGLFFRAYDGSAPSQSSASGMDITYNLGA
jgi:hypothetical protein